ncbi:MAG: hypothetical protein ACR2HH_13485 [Chthoniobacterales bacterium]
MIATAQFQPPLRGSGERRRIRIEGRDDAAILRGARAAQRKAARVCAIAEESGGARHRNRSAQAKQQSRRIIYQAKNLTRLHEKSESETA